MSEPAASRAPSAAAGGRGRFTPWGLLLRTLGVWIRNLPAFTAVSIVIQLPAAALELRAGDTEAPGVIVPFAVFSWFLSQIANAALSLGVLESLGGARRGPLALLAATAQRLWPVFAVAAVYSAMVFLGLFALVVPGIFVFVTGFLAIPAVLAEPELGTEGALRRSVSLTQGHRLALLAAVAVLVALELAVVKGTDLALPATLAVASPARVAATNAAAAFVSGFTGCCAAVAYHDLRVRRGEGAPRVRPVVSGQ